MTDNYQFALGLPGYAAQVGVTIKDADGNTLVARQVGFVATQEDATTYEKSLTIDDDDLPVTLFFDVTGLEGVTGEFVAGEGGGVVPEPGQKVSPVLDLANHGFPPIGEPRHVELVPVASAENQRYLIAGMWDLLLPLGVG